MPKTRIHKFIALLLLLAFTSQTMATAAMNCEQEKMESSHSMVISEMDMAVMDMTIMDMSGMDHKDPTMLHMHHNMSKTDHSQNTHQQFDCCKTMGHCLFGGCTFLAADYGITFLFNKINSIAEDFYLGIAPNPLVSSLYRPPIFC